MLTQCWAPCFKLNSGYLSLERASRLIALYTAVTHVVILLYAVWILCGGQSDTFFTPFFEFGRKDMYFLAVLLILYCLVYIILGSYGLIHALNSETRFFYLPWLYCTLMEVLFFTGFGIFLYYRYYHNVSISNLESIDYITQIDYAISLGMVLICVHNNVVCLSLSFLPLSGGTFSLLCHQATTRTYFCSNLPLDHSQPKTKNVAPKSPHLQPLSFSIRHFFTNVIFFHFAFTFTHFVACIIIMLYNMIIYFFLFYNNFCYTF